MSGAVEDGEVDADPPVRRIVHGVAIGPEESAVSGVRFIDMRGTPEGGWEVFIEPGPTDDVASGPDGAFALPWIRDQETCAFLVMHDDAVLETVEGGRLEGEEEDLGWIVTAAEDATVPLTLRFRDAEGALFVLPVDAATGKSVVVDSKAIECFRVHARVEEDGTSVPFLDEIQVRPADSGWFRPGPYAKRGSRGVGGAPTATLRLLVPGYTSAELEAPLYGGRLRVPLRAPAERIRGAITLPVDSPSDAPKKSGLFAMLLKDGKFIDLQSEPSIPRGIPLGPGKFELIDLAPGAWRLELAQVLEDGVRVAVRTFQAGSGDVDLGTIQMLPGPSVRVVARDRENRPMQGVRIGFERTGLVVEDPHSARRNLRIGLEAPFLQGSKAVDDSGAAEFNELIPGAEYVFRVYSMDLASTVRVGEEPEMKQTVELQWEGRMVRCRLRLLPDERVEAPWTGLSTPSHRFVIGEDQIIEGDLPSGGFTGILRSEVAGNRAVRSAYLRVFIPDAEAEFETELEMDEGSWTYVIRPR